MGVVLVEIRTLLRQTIVPQTALNMAVRAFPGAPLAAQLKLRQDRFTSNVCRETQTLPKLVQSEAGLFEKRGLCISTTTNPILFLLRTMGMGPRRFGAVPRLTAATERFYGAASLQNYRGARALW